MKLELHLFVRIRISLVRYSSAERVHVVFVRTRSD